MQYKHILKELREKHKLTQREAGTIIGISQQHYGLYETSQRSMPIELYAKLADYYNCTIDQLCGRTPYIENQETAGDKDEE